MNCFGSFVRRMSHKRASTSTSYSPLAFLALVVITYVAIEAPSTMNENATETIVPSQPAHLYDTTATTSASSHSGMSIRIYDGEYNATVDFPIRAVPIPPDLWHTMDNHTCLGQGLLKYPTADEDEWQRRTPYALLIGAMKAGTTALFQYLGEHPLVANHVTRKKELHFFDYFYEEYRTEHGIQRAEGRKAYFEAFETTVNVTKERFTEFPNMIAIDNSPRYLFASDFIPASVLCVAPWTKVLAILRNPIDRAYSQYNMKLADRWGANKAYISVEEWFQRDLDDLRRVGVIQDNIPQSQFSGSIAEYNAWKAYTRLGTHAPIGRGLYVIQLRHWFKAFEDFGKSRSDFMIIHSELMRENTVQVYQRVLDFLQLPEHQLQNAEEIYTGRYPKPLNDETRRKLNDFYAPYNSELYALLGSEWDGAWDAKE